MKRITTFILIILLIPLYLALFIISGIAIIPIELSEPLESFRKSNTFYTICFSLVFCTILICIPIFKLLPNRTDN